MVKTLSVGIESTLGNWHKLCSATFGPDSKPTKFIENKIADAPNGEDEEVIADESQFLYVLGEMFIQDERTGVPLHDGLHK